MGTNGKEKILVVDDVQANIVLMKAILSKSSYEIVTATTGLNIMELIAQEQPDLILLDIMMAGMDGYEVLRSIRANEETKKLPVVMVSALGSPEEVEKAYELGANDFITKPIVIPQLLNIVKNQLALSKM